MQQKKKSTAKNDVQSVPNAGLEKLGADPLFPIVGIGGSAGGLECQHRLEDFIDLSDHKLVENQIKELTRFPSESPSPVLRISSQGILKYANAAAPPLLSVMNAAKTGDSVNAEWQAHINEAVANAHPITIETLTGDRTFDVTIAPVANHDYLNLYALDITKAKRAEEALRQSEATIRNKLKAIIEPEGDIGALELSDIIDTDVLQSIMEDFYQLTGMLGAVVDISGNVLVAVGWQDICTKFHRVHPETCKNCIESDTLLTHGVAPGTFKAYHCKNHMWDIVTPLMIGDRQVGNVFIGQFFYKDEPPDVELFRTQARKYGFDEKEYLTALEKVPRFSRKEVAASMRFYSKLSEIISTFSFSAIQQSRLLAERKQAGKALAESEHLFRTTVEDLQTGIVVNAADSSIVLSNPAACRILGLNAEQITGKTVTDPLWNFVRADGSNLPAKELPAARVISTGKSVSNQIVGIKKPGHTELTWINASAVPIFSENNQLLRVIGNFMDITERKQAEEALRVSEEKLRLIIDTSPVGICTVDPLGNFVMTNQAYEQMLGYSKEELKGISFYDVTHPEDRPANKKLFQRMFSLPAGGFSMEKRYIRKDGATIDVAVNATRVMDATGHARFGTAFVRDISAQKKMAENLAHHQATLESEVLERTKELRQTVNLMAGRENRMADLKLMIKKLCTQLEDAGMTAQDSVAKEIANSAPEPLDGETNERPA